MALQFPVFLPFLESSVVLLLCAFSTWLAITTLLRVAFEPFQVPLGVCIRLGRHCLHRVRCLIRCVFLPKFLSTSLQWSLMVDSIVVCRGCCCRLDWNQVQRHQCLCLGQMDFGEAFLYFIFEAADFLIEMLFILLGGVFEFQKCGVGHWRSLRVGRRNWPLRSVPDRRVLVFPPVFLLLLFFLVLLFLSLALMALRRLVIGLGLGGQLALWLMNGVLGR